MAAKRATTSAPKKTARKPAPQQREVPIRHVVPDDMMPFFSDGATIQHSENEFILSFFQNEAPLTLTEADRRKLKEVKSHCIVRLVITPAQMAKNLTIFKANFDAWVAKQAKRS